MALAAVRATREAEVRHGNGERLPAVVGRPIAGEQVGAETFDGKREAAIFPGDLPEEPAAVFAPEFSLSDTAGGFRRRQVLSAGGSRSRMAASCAAAAYPA